MSTQTLSSTLTTPLIVTIQSTPNFSMELFLAILVCIAYYLCLLEVNNLMRNFTKNRRNAKNKDSTVSTQGTPCKIIEKIDHLLAVTLSEHKRLELNRVLLPKFKSQTYLKLFNGIGDEVCRRFHLEQPKPTVIQEVENVKIDDDIME